MARINRDQLLGALGQTPQVQQPQGPQLGQIANLLNALESRRTGQFEREQKIAEIERNIEKAEQEKQQAAQTEEKAGRLGQALTGRIRTGLGNVPAEQVQSPQITETGDLAAPTPPPRQPTTGEQAVEAQQTQLATELNPKKAAESLFDARAFSQEQQAELTQEAIQFQRDIALEQEKSRLRIQEASQKPNPDVRKKKAAQDSLTGVLSEMLGHYTTLQGMAGQVIDVEKPTAENIVAGILTMGPAQSVAGKLGTKAQSARNKINMSRPLLINFIRQASEMGARGIDSEKELEFYLQAATDPTKDIQTNKAALARLDRAYGNGELAKQLEEENIQQLQERFNNLSPQEQSRLESAHASRIDQLRQITGDPNLRLTGSGTGITSQPSGSGGLTPEEQAELEQLRRELGVQ